MRNTKIVFLVFGCLILFVIIHTLFLENIISIMDLKAYMVIGLIFLVLLLYVAEKIKQKITKHKEK